MKTWNRENLSIQYNDNIIELMNLQDLIKGKISGYLSTTFR